MLSSIAVADVAEVRSQGACRFVVATKVPFGVSAQQEMLLEAPDARIRDKWLAALARDVSTTAGFSSDRAELLAEGPLLKIARLGAANKERWFRLTTKKLAYLTCEAGVELAATPFDYVTRVLVGPAAREFTVTSVQPFTASGGYEVRCRCPDANVRAKWLAGLARVIPAGKFMHPN